MINEQLLEFIKSELQQGSPALNITNALIAQGWQPDQVQEAFHSLSLQTTPITPKKGKAKKVALLCLISVVVLIVIAVVLIFFLPTILSLFAKDIPPINDEDLTSSTVVIPKEQNAFYDLVNIKKPLVYTSDSAIAGIKDPGKWDANAVQDALARNAHLFALLDVALQKPQFQNPIFVDPSFLTIDSLGDTSKIVDPFALLVLGQYAEIKGQNMQLQGNDKEALNEVLKISDLGQKIVETQPNIFEYLTGIGLKRIGFSAAQRIVFRSKLTSNEIIQKITVLEKYKKNSEGIINAFRAQYLFDRERVSDLQHKNKQVIDMYLSSSGDDKSNPKNQMQLTNFSFEPNKTKQIIYQHYKSAIADIQLPCNALKDYKSIEPEQKPLTAVQNSIGIILANSLTGAASVSDFLPKRCNDLLFVNVTQVMFALKAFKIDNNRLPNTLSELVPKYISVVPDDPYSNKPLLYVPSKNIIYSVGVNGVDGGGNTGEDWAKMVNPTFNISF